MKVSRFNPQAVVQQAMKAAEQVLDRAASGGKITNDIAAQLPPALKQASDSFAADGVDRAEVLQAFVQSLEGQLSQSLKAGAFVPGEVEKALDTLNFSRLGIQLSQLLKAANEPTTTGGADAAARLALQTADTTLTSQLEAFDALKTAAQVHADDNPKGAVAGLLKSMVKERGKLMQKVVDNLVRDAERADKELTDAGTRETLQVAVSAALDVHKAVSPKGVRTKALAKQQQQLGAPVLDQAAQQPFFARFLENQAAQFSGGPQGAVKGEAPTITEQSKPGDLVTMKFPSDNEDNLPGDGEDMMVTKKFPSDNDEDIDLGDLGKTDPDGGNVDGEIGDVMVTRKFPSDNDEDFGNEFDPNLVTLKFPSDAEDGMPDRPEDPIFTTMKFPSDNEDNPLPELRPELIVELAPELVPELRPELQPELIPEIAPELRPETDPGGLTPVRREMLDTEARVMESAFKGAVGVEKRLEAIDHTLQTARLPQDAYDRLTREKASLGAFYGGADDIQHRVKELKHLLTVGNFTAEGAKKVEEEIAMNVRLLDDLAPIGDVLHKLNATEDRSPAQEAQRSIIQHFADDGFKVLSDRLDQIHNTLQTARLTPEAYEALELEAAGTKAFMYGHEALEGRIEEIDGLFMTALIDQDGTRKLSAERTMMKGLLAALQTFDSRGQKIRDTINTPGPLPEIAPEIRPELIPEIAPELIPELRPELIPEIAPEIRPETGPGDLSKSQREAMRVQQAVNKAAYYGEERLEARMGEINDLLTAGTLAPDVSDKLKLELGAIEVFMGGVPALDKKIKDERDFATRARFSPEGYEQHQALIGMYEGLRKDLSRLEARVDGLGRRRHHTSAERAEMVVLEAALQGFKAMDQKQIEIHDILRSGTLDVWKVQQYTLEAEGLKAYRSGAPAVQEQLEELDRLSLVFGGTPEEHQKLTDKQDLLRMVLKALNGFRERSLEIDDQLDPPDIHPELIPEIAPELRPEIRPELIVELAPELIPELRPEMIAEVAPDVLPRPPTDDDD